MKPHHPLLIVNRKSRRTADRFSELRGYLSAAGLPVRYTYDASPAEIPEIIQRHRTEVDCVIIGAGDGTLSRVAAPLIETGLPLGILPLGTANDLARTLQIPPDLEAACNIIADGHLQRVDVGKANSTHFFNVANIGLGVRVHRYLSSEKKRRWGILAYPLATFAALREIRPFHATITCDNHTARASLIQIVVANGRHYGGGMTVSQDATLDDDLLFLFALAPQPISKLLVLSPSLRLGWYRQQKGVNLLKGKKITVTTKRPMSIVTDGERTEKTPVQFEVLPGAISAFVPLPIAAQAV